MAQVDFANILKDIENGKLKFDLLMTRPQTIQRDEAYYELFEVFSDLAYPRVISIPLEGGNKALYIERELLKKTIDFLAQKFSDKAGFEKHVNNFRLMESLVEERAQSSLNVKKSKKDLLEAFLAHRGHVKEIADCAWGPFAVENIIAPKLSESLRHVLASPTKLNDFQKMRVDICKAVIDGANPVVASQELARKYYWYPEYSYIEKLYDAEFFVSEIGKLSIEKATEEMNRTLGEIKRSQVEVKEAIEAVTDPETLLIAHIVNEYTYLRTARVDLFKKLQAPARRIFDLIAELLSDVSSRPWSRLEVVTMSNDEIVDYLTDKDVPVFDFIKSRSRSLYYRDPSGEVVVGDEDVIRATLLAVQASVSKEIKGAIAFKGIVRGEVALVFSRNDLDKVKPGSILVARTTMPDYTHAMERAAAFVTEEGGITSHAAIIARELKKPCIVGTGNCTKVLKDRDMIEVDAERGVVRIMNQQ